MTYKQAVNWVNSLPRLAKHPGVVNTAKLLKILNNPDKDLKFVHIAGTNGKGSTTMMISSILQKAGYKIGATISPYVLDFKERFLINGSMVCEEKIAKALTMVKQAVQLQDEIVAFDAVTAAAIIIFNEEKCDIVCLETGLGGRLDSTNAVQNTLVACITAIGKDHTELLGDTIEQIASEKCGIIKNNCDVVSYPVQSAGAVNIIKKHCNEKKSVLYIPDVKNINFINEKDSVKQNSFTRNFLYEGMLINLPFAGMHQVYNATVAIQAVKLLAKHNFIINTNNIISGLNSVKFAARIEMVSKNPTVIIDGAHNAHGVHALVNTLQQEGYNNLVCIVGTLKGKDTDDMMEKLAKIAKKVFTVTPNNDRGLKSEELAIIANKYIGQVEMYNDINKAVKKGLIEATQNNTALLICGSLYLSSTVRKLFVK